MQSSRSNKVENLAALLWIQTSTYYLTCLPLSASVCIWFNPLYLCVDVLYGCSHTELILNVAIWRLWLIHFCKELNCSVYKTNDNICVWYTCRLHMLTDVGVTGEPSLILASVIRVSCWNVWQCLHFATVVNWQQTHMSCLLISWHYYCVK